MHTTEGIVLRKTPAGETDAVFTLFTKDYGKIKAVAQGVRKEGAKLKGFLEPFNMVLVGIVSGKRIDRVVHASFIHFLPEIRASYLKLSALFFMADLVDRECFLGEKDEALWQLLQRSILRLEGLPDDAKSRELFLNTWEQEFFKAQGYGDSFDRPEVEGRDLTRPW